MSSSCFRTGDNKYSNCPPRMADGRHFTDYRPSSYVDDLIRVQNNIANTFQYNIFCRENAEAIMNRNRQIACEQNCCGPCPTGNDSVETFDGSTMMPEQFMFVTDGRMGKFVMNNPNGVGTGRKYWSFDHNPTECNDLPSAWPSGPKNVCVGPQDSFAYLGDANPIPSPLRQAGISGGEILSGSKQFA